VISAQGQRDRPARDQVGEALVHAEREARRVRGGEELVEHLLDGLRARVGEVECLPLQLGLVRDVVERRHHPVHRHDVGVAEIEPHQRQPLRQQPPRALDGLEEVVRAVDLVHLARLRVAHHDRRAVHAPGHIRLLAHDALGLELGAVVGGGQLLALVEHRLLERAAVVTGHGDRGHVVQPLRLQRARELHGVRGAAHVDGRVHLRGRGHVVHRGQVEEVDDLAAQLAHLLLLHAQQRPAQVAHDRLHAFGGGGADHHAPALDQVFQALQRLAPHEHVDLALALVEQSFDQAPPDESGGAGDEVGHRA